MKAISIILVAASAFMAPDRTAGGQESGSGSGHSAEAAEQLVPGGVFSLWKRVETFPSASELNLPLVAGLSARFAWSAVEPQPGAYQWDALDAAHDLTMRTKKWLMVRVTAGMNSPSWVYDRGCRKITFPAEDTNFMKPGAEATMPVPWDEAYLAAWEQFLQAFGQHIRTWENLYCVQMTGGGFIGEMHLPKTSAGVVAQWKAAGISDEKLIAMWQRIIRAYDKSMPPRVGLALDLGQPFQKSQATPAIFAWALEKYPGRVWFQQNGLNERVTAEGQYAKMLRLAARTTTVGYQMLGGGKFLDQQTGDRRKCFERAIGDGCKYVEVYRQDLLDPKWHSAIDYLADGLRRNARPTPRSKVSLDPEVKASVPPKGICAMALREAAVKEALLQSSCIEGITIDSWWSDCEPKDAEYDWTLLDRKTKQISTTNKWVLLRVASGSKAFPQWMLPKCKTLKIIDPVEAHPTYRQEIEVPIPWDEDLIRYKTRLYQQIGQHYADNPQVRLMAIAIANVRTDDWFMPTRMGNLERWRNAGYGPDKLISAGKQIIDAAMKSFPRNILLAIGELQQDKDPLYVAKTLLAYAEQEYPGRLIAQINSVSARTVRGEKAKGAWGLLYENRPRTAGQMVWAVTGDNTFRMNGKQPGDPLDIMRRALDACLSYNMNYVEIYQRDAVNPQFAGLLKEFNDGMKDLSK